ncbi:RecX family transcriptional regulator [Sphingomonas sp. PB2P12]|uniref:regulatory protein RecX n=1 Tax=Sphingomonas sandaracina TaxID=3096157 RepID=UPI002FCA9CB2
MSNDDDSDRATGRPKSRGKDGGAGLKGGLGGGRGNSRGGGRNAERAPPKPLDAAALERMALRYVERFATTRGRLTDYLMRKIRERGWDGGSTEASAEPAELAQRMADLGYVDDRAFAEQRAAAMQRRGLGARRVAGAFREAGIDEGDAESVAPAIADRAVESALAFARRKRIGPYGNGDGDRKLHEKQLAAMMRAGHRFDLARRIVAAPPSDTPELVDFD